MLARAGPFFLARFPQNPDYEKKHPSMTVNISQLVQKVNKVKTDAKTNNECPTVLAEQQQHLQECQTMLAACKNHIIMTSWCCVTTGQRVLSNLIQVCWDASLSPSLCSDSTGSTPLPTGADGYPANATAINSWKPVLGTNNLVSTKIDAAKYVRVGGRPGIRAAITV